MPTPFTHLQIASQLLQDPRVSPEAHALIAAHQPCFLLGGIVADQRLAGMDRQDTHFYHYTRPMPDNPWREMFRQYPRLSHPKSDAHHAFLMGYVAHLAADEYWSRYMLGPHFASGHWGEDARDRFFVLHLLLIWMDERDEARLPETTASLLRQCMPHDWLPFLPDHGICDWRDFLADQLDGDSETLAIFGGRIRTEPRVLRAMLDDSALMQERLWDNITPQLLTDMESKLYDFSREQMDTYLREFGQ
ncbi:MAG: zinc dependent phospholipase C family protein [Anaerolineae bacterium]|nr:zinc dependent phospholipase C family protein [Anaerolineae bacterium]